MKKILTTLLVGITGIFLTSCLGKREIAMVTDGILNDNSFNQGTWNGIEKYLKENKKLKAKFYQAKSNSQNDYMATFDVAIKSGAKIVIAVGYYFSESVHEAQVKYPEIKFLIIDATPHKGDYVDDFKENTMSALFKEEEAGFLAGYAVFKDGKRKFGFMGGSPVAPVKKYGIGYLSGLYYAANEEGEKNYKFETRFFEYLDGFEPKDTYKSKAASWYNEVDVIFASAGGAGSSIFAALGKKKDKWAIGVDSDQAKDHEQIITSAIKAVDVATYDILKELFNNNNFKGGTIVNYSIENNGVGITTSDYKRFAKFNKNMYDAILEKIKTKIIVVPDVIDDLVNFLKNLGLSNLDDAYYEDLKSIIR